MNQYIKLDNETTTEWLARLSAAGNRSIKNIEKVKSDMKRDGVIGFCPECSCDIYKDREHICSVK